MAANSPSHLVMAARFRNATMLAEVLDELLGSGFGRGQLCVVNFRSGPPESAETSAPPIHRTTIGSPVPARLPEALAASGEVSLEQRWPCYCRRNLKVVARMPCRLQALIARSFDTEARGAVLLIDVTNQNERACAEYIFEKTPPVQLLFHDCRSLPTPAATTKN
jgi:hypothetical protein